MAFGALYIVGDLRQVMKLQRCAVFVNQTHEVDAVKEQAFFAQEEFILRKIKSLFDQVYILCSHAWKFKNSFYVKG